MSEIKKIKPWKIMLTVVIGLLVIAFLFFKEFKLSAFEEIQITWFSVFWFLIAFLCIFARDLGYIIRIRILSGKQLSWRQAFRVIMLWEFTSTVTPGAVGGTGVAFMYVHKEGVNLGKSSSIVMVTSLLDELYFVLIFPLMLLILGGSNLFFGVDDTAALDPDNLSGWSYGLFWFALIAYIIKFVWVLLMIYGLFINPKRFSRMIYRVFQLPFLKRWKRKVARVVHDIEYSSKEMKSKKISFWIKTFLATILSWTSRYWVANCLFLIFLTNSFNHFLIFGRQLVMSLVLLITPTPGGSGVAEIMFNEYLCTPDIIESAGESIDLAGVSIILVLLWRLVTFYPYLIIGTVMMPKWINDNFISKKK